MVYYRYKKKSPSRKKRFRKSPVKRTGILRFPTSPFPKILKTKMIYSDHSSITSGESGLGTPQVYRLNSLYDPDLTGLGGQPMGLDSLCGATNGNAPYYRYIVTGAKVDIQFLNGAADQTFILMKAMDQSTLNVPANVLEAKERGWSTLALAQTSAGGSIKRYSRYFDISTICSARKSEMTISSDYAAVYNANPIGEAKFYIAAQDVNFSGTNTITYLLKITYYVTLAERNELDQS